MRWLALLLPLAGCLLVFHGQYVGDDPITNHPVEATVSYCVPEPPLPYCFNERSTWRSFRRQAKGSDFLCSLGSPIEPPPGLVDLRLDPLGTDFVPSRTRPVATYGVSLGPEAAASPCGLEAAGDNQLFLVPIYRQPGGWDPGQFRRCQAMGSAGDTSPPYWLDATYCPDGFSGIHPNGWWNWFVNSEQNKGGIASSCGEGGNTTFGRSFRPDVSPAADAQRLPSSPVKGVWNQQSDGSYSVTWGVDFPSAGYPADSSGWTGHPCCGTGAQCLAAHSQPGDAMFSTFVGFGPAGAGKFPGLGEMVVRADLRIVASREPPPGNKGNDFTFGVIAVYSRAAGSVYPTCTSRKLPCLGGKRIADCEWCDTGEPESADGCISDGRPWGCCQGPRTGNCGVHGFGADIQPFAPHHPPYTQREHFDGEQVFFDATEAGLIPRLTSQKVAYEIDASSLWRYAQTITMRVPHGCGASSCLPSSCRPDGSCDQRLLAEAPSDLSKVKAYPGGFSIEPRGGLLLVEMSRFRVGPR